MEGDTKTTSDSQEFPLRCALQLMAVATRALWLVGVLVSLQKRGASCLSPQLHGSGNPFLNFRGCFCSISSYPPILLVNKEDKRLFI